MDPASIRAIVVASDILCMIQIEQITNKPIRHPTGAAPVIEDDGGVLLAETGAIAEYILTKYGTK